MTGVQRLLEVGLLLSGALAVFLLVSLVTFHPADPSWSQSGHTGDIQNAAGAIGAWCADILLFVLGFVAYLMPFVVISFGYLLFHRPHELLSLDYLGVSLRIIGALLLLTGAAALSSLNFSDIYYFSSGGVLGDVVSGAMLPYFNLLGTTLLLLTFMMTGFTLVTGWSWLTIVDRIGHYCIVASLWLVNKVRGQGGHRTGTSLIKTSDKKAQDPEFALEHHGEADFTLDDDFSGKPKSDKKSWWKRLLPAKKERINREQRDTDYSWDEMPSATSDFHEEPDNLPSLQAYDEADDIDLSDLDEPFTQGKTASPAKRSVKMDAGSPTKTKPKPVVQRDQTDLQERLLPTIELLDRPNKTTNPLTQEELDQISSTLEAVLKDFGVEVQVAGVQPGPVVTRFELDLAPGVKVSKISNLAKDIARSLSALAVRVVEVIPGKSYVGLELPNKSREIVWLREVISCDAFQKSASPLTMVLGKDIAGKPVVVDLAKMPHLLVAGTTGSGKSVGVNVMILSLLYKSQPEDVRLIMIDPKMLELSVYEGIPHLLTEVVTDMKDAANALRWCVGEMERRYKLMSAVGVRNLKGYNAKVAQGIADGEPLKDPTWKPGDSMHESVPELEHLPHIVVVVDEFADMMMIVGKKVEELIARIAQKARAAGIHLILATQRPSVDVITGLIKANIPTRIAFQVSSKIDSRTILDQSGAEQLLGQGDMLYLPPGSGVPTRVHGAFVDDHEVHAVVADWKSRQKPKYLNEILAGDSNEDGLLPGEQPSIGDEEADALFDEAVAFVTESRRVSVSSVQRKFRIGYNRAARIVEQMEMTGVVSTAGHNGAREVLAPPPPRD
ncbi:cell division protein FtsK [Aliidiomarina minuta]|uniref:DNA translocase FtsK n=1 Tax=Aliidiomarina minuta TaxID=880057 RepID=A0A432W733_9GAMM|nr:cell division protein FtsK [Aliidiomarina minuta]